MSVSHLPQNAPKVSDSIDGDLRPQSLTTQLKKLAPYLLLLFGPASLVLAIVVVVHRLSGIPIRYFMIDPVSEFNAPMYLGCVSNLGVLLWCTAAAVCLFSGAQLAVAKRQREFALFLLCSGGITSVLMLDDLFLLHEEVLPDHFHIPQMLVFVAYGVMVCGYLVRFRRVILQTEFLLLLISMLFFALTAFVDLFVYPEEFSIAGFPARHLLEDGLKFFGIVAWAGYLIRVSCQQMARACGVQQASCPSG